MPNWAPPNGEWKSITNPSSTHVARSGQSSIATPPAIGSGTEIATLDYDEIDDNDGTYLNIDASTTNYYPYLMWEWRIPLCGDAKAFHKIIFSHWCWGYGYRSTKSGALYGCKLYVWNAATSAWELVDSSTTSTKDQLSHTVPYWDTALNYVVSGTGRLHACLIGTYAKPIGYISRIRVDHVACVFKSADGWMLR